jgi:hypothetical protein
MWSSPAAMTAAAAATSSARGIREAPGDQRGISEAVSVSERLPVGSVSWHRIDQICRFVAFALQAQSTKASVLR